MKSFTSFKKGHQVNLGKKHTLETIEKRRIKMLGHKVSDETRNNISKSLKGHSVSEETREKIRLGHLGKKASEETRKKKSLSQKGEKGSNWKGGISPLNIRIRNSIEYKLWREAVFTRDNWTCVWCLIRGVKLNADHIKPFSLFPELRFALDNGRTLCVPCHKTINTRPDKHQELYLINTVAK